MARGGIALAPTITIASVTAEAVAEWLDSAIAGDVLVYFTGPMALQSVPAVAAARRLHDAGKVCLFQQRRGPALFDYCMKKRVEPERRPLSRSEIEDSMARDLKILLAVLRRLANFDHVCPSNAKLADEAGLKDAESVRYRLVQLVIGGHIDIASSPQGPRVITIRSTGKKTRAA